jgi:dipeptidyl aminopeptidase/acylaminoacyl peptidase
MGIVYRAVDTKLGRTVALKMLPDDLVDDSKRRGLFMREARTAAAINHPNVATVYEVGETDDTVYIALEHIEGDTLRDALRADRLSRERVLEIAGDIARGLEAAHELGVIHRDLKPGNVMINERGEVKLLDFGLAKSIESRPAEGTEDTEAATVESQLMGTPAYMSPEQVRGDAVDKRSDVFAFGTLLYELLAGERPFAGDTLPELGVAIMNDTPEPLSSHDTDLPQALINIVERCLSKIPADRYADGAALVRALAAFETAAQTGGPTRPSARKRAEGRRLWPFAAIAAVAVLCGIVAWWAIATRGGGSDPERDAAAKTIVDPPAALEERALTDFRAPRHIPTFAVSRDGRRMAYIEDPSRKAFVEDTAGGQRTELPAIDGAIFFVPLDFFPAGDELLVAIIGTDGSQRVATLDLKTHAVRTVYDAGAFAARVSPDGASVALVHDGVRVVAASGGEERVLVERRQTRAHSPAELSWSPDGARIVVGSWQPSSTLEVITVKTGAVDKIPVGGVLEQTSNQEVVVEWTGDDRIVFARERKRGSDLWHVRVPNGDWDGHEPQRLRAFDTFLLKGLRYGGGRLFFLKIRPGASVFVAGREADRLPPEKTRRITQTDGRDLVWGWLPDGRVLFISDRDGNYDLYAKSADATTPDKLADLPDPIITATAVGDRALFTARVDDRCHVYRVGDAPEPVRIYDADANVAACPPAITCAVDAPDTCVIVEVVEQSGTYRSFNPRTGQLGATIYEGGFSGNHYISLSPDGGTLAWAKQDRRSPAIALLDIETGTLTLRPTPNNFIPHDLAWTSDGDGWVISGFYPNAITHYIAYLSRAGELRELVVTKDQPHNPASSPDSQQVAFNMDRFERNIWVLQPPVARR